MHIKSVDISSFRKLLSVRVDLSETTTVFVGANNSGKTSAMLALRYFLSSRAGQFDVHDFTLCHWSAIDAIGEGWRDARANEKPIDARMADWARLVPTLDLWLHVEADELHHVRDLIPTLDWEGDTVGVRLRYEPKDVPALSKDFLAALQEAQDLKAAASMRRQEQAALESIAPPPKLTIWPTSLMDFLRRRLADHFTIRAYTLDPAEQRAAPQSLRDDAQPIQRDPLDGLIRVSEIPAQRGFGQALPSDGDEVIPTRGGGSRLSDELRAYYSKHLDPTNRPDPSDLDALQAIEAAQDAFDARLADSFKTAFDEVDGMGYPGLTDPRPNVSTRLKATDGLNHAAAVSFVVDVVAEDGTTRPAALPEGSNGLGYQNLISMIFRLMCFRDGWMRVGKAAKTRTSSRIEPLHLVLIEEPEAHLHVQVQQVFINKAYEVLHGHDELRDNKKLCTQLIVGVDPISWTARLAR